MFFSQISQILQFSILANIEFVYFLTNFFNMASPESRCKTRRLINECEYGDDFDEPGFDPDDYLSDEADNQEAGASAEVGAPPTTSAQPVEGTSAGAPPTTSTKAKAKRKLSSVWDHFDRVVDPKTKKIKGQCKYCSSILAIVQGSTSSLTRHAKKCAPKKGSNDPKQTRLSTSGNNIGIESSSYSPLDPDIMRSKMRKMIV